MCIVYMIWQHHLYLNMIQQMKRKINEFVADRHWNQNGVTSISTKCYADCIYRPNVRKKKRKHSEKKTPRWKLNLLCIQISKSCSNPIAFLIWLSICKTGTVKYHEKWPRKTYKKFINQYETLIEVALFLVLKSRNVFFFWISSKKYSQVK